MTEKQEALLKIFIAFDQICRKYGLRYCLCGGSCIGAVRHKGFIPWDDDMDVFMPEEDMNIFIKIPIEEYLDANRYQISVEKRTRNFQIVDTEKLFSTSQFVKCLTGCDKRGVNFDIFPVTGAGNTKLSAWIHTANVFLYRGLYKASKNHKRIWAHDRKKYMMPFVMLGRAINWGKFINAEKMLEKYETAAYKYQFKDCKYVGSYMGQLTFNEIYLKEWLEPIEVDFEGCKAFIPKEYDQYLTQMYGDYMTPPPIEMQVEKHLEDAV